MKSCETAAAIGAIELKQRLAKAIDYFSNHVEEINSLNVFPVPDGDTGINMHHTLRRAYREIASLETASVSEIMREFAQGSLMGARGNSGAILSQLFKGFAEGLGNTDSLTSACFSIACENAVALAYAAVTTPVEGTILTVARESSASISRNRNANPDLGECFSVLLQAAERSLLETPNKLQVLKDAGVVDAGAMGLVVFLRGLVAEQDSEPPVSPRYGDAKPAMSESNWTPANPQFGYDVQFLMRGLDLDINGIRHDLERMGWSVIVAGDANLAKVHIHVDNPAHPLDYAIKSGAELDDIVVENMSAQYRRLSTASEALERTPKSQLTESEYAVVSVAQGDGMRAIFRDLGCAETIAGGQGRNPSVEDFLDAIRQIRAKRPIILPNNRNIFLSACQAAELVDDGDVRVLQTQTMLQGISAMLAFGDGANGDIAFDELMSNMQSAADQVISIEITRANRSGNLDQVDFQRGEFIAIVDGEIRAAAQSVENAVIQGFRTIDIGIAELATIYYGEDTTESDAIRLIERLSNALTGLQFELIYGGQSVYPFLIGVE